MNEQQRVTSVCLEKQQHRRTDSFVGLSRWFCSLGGDINYKQIRHKFVATENNYQEHYRQHSSHIKHLDKERDIVCRPVGGDCCRRWRPL